jgi:hypothetical protein
VREIAEPEFISLVSEPDMPSTIGLRHSGTLAGNEEIWLPAGALRAEAGELTLPPEWLARAG